VENSLYKQAEKLNKEAKRLENKEKKLDKDRKVLNKNMSNLDKLENSAKIREDRRQRVRAEVLELKK